MEKGKRKKTAAVQVERRCVACQKPAPMDAAEDYLCPHCREQDGGELHLIDDEVDEFMDRYGDNDPVGRQVMRIEADIERYKWTRIAEKIQKRESLWNRR